MQKLNKKKKKKTANQNAEFLNVIGTDKTHGKNTVSITNMNYIYKKKSVLFNFSFGICRTFCPIRYANL